MDKLNLLTTKFPELIRSADPNVKPVFGKMNLQQMVEHMSDAVRNANGKLSFELLTPPERVEAMQHFVRSEKEFKPNTKNVLLGEEPEPVKNKDLASAIEEYEMEIRDFQNYFAKDPNVVLMNPFFGPLNFSDWCDLLYQHATHHLKQFALIE